MERNRETAGLLKETIRMAWPAVLESVFIQLAGMIDTMMVSSLGTYAVSAVGLTVQPKFIALSLFISMSVAVSALVARRRGQERREDANRIMIASVLFSAAACLVITVLSIALMNPILRFCGSNADTHEAACVYFRIIQGGMIFNVLSFIINAAQRGSGNTRIAMTCIARMRPIAPAPVYMSLHFSLFTICSSLSTFTVSITI